MPEAWWDHFFAARLGSARSMELLLAEFEKLLRQFFKLHDVPDEHLEGLAMQTFEDLFHPANLRHFTRGHKWGVHQSFEAVLFGPKGPAWVVLKRHRRETPPQPQAMEG